MSLFKKSKQVITVEYVTGRGIKTKSVTFKKHLIEKNVYTIMRTPSECIRVTVEEK